MISDLSPPAKIPARFAQAPWHEHTAFWRQLDDQLPHDHLARDIQDAMVHLDLTPLYQTYKYRGKIKFIYFPQESKNGRHNHCLWRQNV
jgi:hypothetical protein